jgi:hypothetical protein
MRRHLSDPGKQRFGEVDPFGYGVPALRDAP